jgi:hypothetical protein
MTTERRSPMRGRRERRLPETKTFALTSEFWVFVVGVAAMLFAGYVLDDLANPTAWRFAAFIGIAYILSRGLAKAGSQRSYEPEWNRRYDSSYDDDNRAEDEWTERRSGAVGTSTGSDVRSNR